MGKLTFIEWIREKLASFCWWGFLKLNNLTEEQYFKTLEAENSNQLDISNITEPIGDKTEMQVDKKQVEENKLYGEYLDN